MELQALIHCSLNYNAHSIPSFFILGEIKDDSMADKKDQSSVGNESKKTDGKDLLFCFVLSLISICNLLFYKHPHFMIKKNCVVTWKTFNRNSH